MMITKEGDQWMGLYSVHAFSFWVILYIKLFLFLSSSPFPLLFSIYVLQTLKQYYRLLYLPRIDQEQPLSC